MAKPAPRPLPEESSTRDALVVLAALLPSSATPRAQSQRGAPDRGAEFVRTLEDRTVQENADWLDQCHLLQMADRISLEEEVEEQEDGL